MSTVKDILAGLKATIELNTKVTAIAHGVERMTGELRDLDRRLVRVETIIEITRPDGGVLKLTQRGDPEPSR